VTRMYTLDVRDTVPGGAPASSRVPAPDRGWHGAPVELPRPPAPLRSPGIGLFRQYGAVLFPSRQGEGCPCPADAATRIPRLFRCVAWPRIPGASPQRPLPMSAVFSREARDPRLKTRCEKSDAFLRQPRQTRGARPAPNRRAGALVYTATCENHAKTGPLLLSFSPFFGYSDAHVWNRWLRRAETGAGSRRRRSGQA